MYKDKFVCVEWEGSHKLYGYCKDISGRYILKTKEELLEISKVPEALPELNWEPFYKRREKFKIDFEEWLKTSPKSIKNNDKRVFRETRKHKDEIISFFVFEAKDFDEKLFYTDTKRISDENYITNKIMQNLYEKYPNKSEEEIGEIFYKILDINPYDEKYEEKIRNEPSDKRRERYMNALKVSKALN